MAPFSEVGDSAEVSRTDRLERPASAHCRVEVGEPHLDEGTDRVLEAGLPRDRERLLVTLPHLLGCDALLEPVVARHEQPLDPRTRVVTRSHLPSVDGRTTVRAGYTAIARRYHGPSMVSVSAVIQVLLGAALVTLVLMHSGRDTGFGGMGFTPTSQGGTHIVERNLTRLTVAVAVLFGVNTVVLYRLLA